MTDTKDFKITLSNTDLRHIMTVLKPVSDPSAVHLQWVVLKCHNGRLRAYRTDRSRLHVVEVPYSGDEGDVTMPVLDKVPKNPYDVSITFGTTIITLDYGETQEIIRRPAMEFEVMSSLDAVIPSQTPELTISMDVKFIADFAAALSKGKIKRMDLEYYGEKKPFVLRVGDTFAVICPILKHNN